MQRKPTSKVHRIAGRTKIAMLPQFPCERTSAIGRDGPKRSEHLQQRMLTEGNYSMTSSARARNEGGTLKPMAPGLCSSVAGTRPNCDDLALHRFFLGSVGDNDAGPAVFMSSSIRRATTRSCRGRIFMASTSLLRVFWFWGGAPRSALPPREAGPAKLMGRSSGAQLQARERQAVDSR